MRLHMKQMKQTRQLEIKRAGFEMPRALLPFFLLFFLPSNSNTISSQDEDQLIRTIGAILNPSSRAGKEEKAAMDMAQQDLIHTSTRLGLLLHVANISLEDTVHAASVAMSMINNHQVQAIIGMQTWPEAAIVADLGRKAQVPVLSFAGSIPLSASDRWPFLIPLAHNRCTEMRAIAAIVGSWRWRRVTVIHEEVDYVSSGINSCLAEALQEVGSEIDYQLNLPPLASSLPYELEKIKSRQCRVFIVHTSIELATRLFTEAKRMGMMEPEYVWITTDSITSLLDFVNSSVISSMQGVLGVKNYFPPTSARLTDFQRRFQQRFRLEYPQEENPEPGIFALKAYDAVWAVAKAMERMSSNASENHPSSFHPKEINEISTDPEIKLKVSADGQKLLETILSSDFEGLTGEFRFNGGQLNPPKVLQVVNVVGKSYREMGFWSQESGFCDAENRSRRVSMEMLGQIYWPGGSWTVPKGWAPPINGSSLRIGVPANSAFREFVNVSYCAHTNVPNVTGFSIDVFKAVVEHLPYSLPYNFIPFNGTYDSLVQQVKLQKFDGVVGDTSIVASRCEYVEFSQPYAESGLAMVVSETSQQLHQPHQPWMFLKPFSMPMWALTALITVYNGFVVWLMEPGLNQGFEDSGWDQLGTVLWFSFTTLFSLHREKLKSNLGRMAMVAWLFVALILTQSYTAKLSSMLTLRGLDTGIMDVESLKKSKATVGCDSGSFVVKYLEEVLGFQPSKIKQYSSGDDYPHALSSGEIAAAFLRVPYANVLLAKSCNALTIAGHTFDVGGFGFAFPKGSPLIPDISKAILQVYERGDISKLKSDLISSYNCSNSASVNDEHQSLSLWSFLGLFAITGGATSVAFIIFIFRWLCPWLHSIVSPVTTAVRGSARGIGSAVMKPYKYVTHRVFKKNVATNATGEGQTERNIEMTQMVDHGPGNGGHVLDLEEPSEIHRQQHASVPSPNSSTSHEIGQ